MNRLFVLLAFSFLFGNAFTQELAPVVTASAGKEFRVDNYSMAFTVGEVVVNTVRGIGYILTQGFHQPPGLYLSGIRKHDNIDIYASVFPNPTSDIVNIVIRNADSDGGYAVQLYNTMGQNIIANVITSNEFGDFIFTIDLSDKSHGTYFIRLINLEQNSKHIDFKVVKLKY